MTNLTSMQELQQVSRVIGLPTLACHGHNKASLNTHKISSHLLLTSIEPTSLVLRYLGKCHGLPLKAQVLPRR
jgi:hypothetical protein